MSRLPARAGLALLALASRGERIEAVYREGAELVFEQRDSTTMETDEVSASVNGVELPPEMLQEAGVNVPSQQQEKTIRFRDHVLETEDGRPIRLRRVFEELRETSVENEEEKEKVGPLEGRALLLEDHDGEIVVALEEEGEEVDGVYLENHHPTHNADLLLPDREVAVGDTWQVARDVALQFVGIRSTPVFFEPENENEVRMGDLVDEGSTATGEVEFVAVEDREGVRCAVLAVAFDIQSEVEGLE